MAETAEWQQADEARQQDQEAQQQPEPVDEEPQHSEAMTSFIKETADLFEEMRKPPKKEAEPAAAPDAPTIAEPSTPQRQDKDTGFIADYSKATPEEFKKRIDYLYGKDQENKRQWDEAKSVLRNIREENEKLRAQLAEQKLNQSAAELDQAQLEVIDLFTPGSPNYNPTLGAQKLRDLTSRDQALKAERDAEKQRSEEFTTKLDEEDRQRNLAETAQVIEAWSTDRPYAQPGHPMYQHVVQWLQRAYHEAPAHVTMQQIVDRAGQVFDDYMKRAPQAPQQPAAPNGNGQARPSAPGAGERMTVSQVIGTQQRGPSQPTSFAEKLSSREREVARKLFFNPEAGVTEDKAYQYYLDGKK